MDIQHDVLYEDRYAPAVKDYYNTLHTIEKSKRIKINGEELDPYSLSKSNYKVILFRMKDLFDHINVDILDYFNDPKSEGFYGIDVFGYAMALYPDIVEDIFDIDLNDINDKYFKNIFDISKISNDVDMAADCLFYSGDRLDFYQSIADLVGEDLKAVDDLYDIVEKAKKDPRYNNWSNLPGYAGADIYRSDIFDDLPHPESIIIEDPRTTPIPESLLQRILDYLDGKWKPRR